MPHGSYSRIGTVPVGQLQKVFICVLAMERCCIAIRPYFGAGTTHLGEVQEVTWTEAFGKMALATYLALAFVAPLAKVSCG